MATLSILDQVFIFLESDSTPMHVGGLMLLTPPEGKTDFATELHQWLTQDGKVGAPYNQKLKMELGSLPQWVEAQDINIHDHIHRRGLAEPGSHEQLMAAVGDICSRRLDRSRPLWDAHIIDGLSNGEVAFYVRMHHSMTDGIRFIKLLSAACSKSPSSDHNPFWKGSEQDNMAKGGKGNPLLSLLSPLRWQRLWQKQLSTSTGLVRLAGKMGLDWCKLVPSDLKRPFSAPRSPLNRQHDQSRAAVMVQVPWQKLSRLAKLTNTSTNDVVMTLCDMAVRRYLEANNWTRQQPLVAMMPMNIRNSESSQQSNNQVSMGAIELGARDASPLVRLKAINEGTLGVKSEAFELSGDAYVQYALAATGMGWLIPSLGLNSLVTPITNMVISNVPGPRNTLYMNGARVKDLLPISLLAPGQSLNITLLSYEGNLCFSFLYCDSALPGFGVVGDHLQDALEELEQATLDSYSEVLALAKEELEAVVNDKGEAPLTLKAS